MLRYSYKVQVKQLKTELLALELLCLKQGKNKGLEEKILKKKKEIEWYENRIKEGKDTGVYAL